MCSISSCTDSLHIQPGSSGESHAASSDGACNFSNIEVGEDVDVIEDGFVAINEDADINIKQEEIPEDIIFPEIKSEPDESCADSLHILPGSSGESHATSSKGGCNFSNRVVEEDVDVIEDGFIAVNEEADIGIKEEENPEYINFPDIKSEPDEGTFSGTFSQQDAMKQHQGMHTVERTFLCDVCNRTFKQLRQLKVHQRVHTGERPYGCHVCNKTFSEKRTLKVHQRVHTGQRPYHCDVCNKAFKQLEHLKLHHRVHTGERPYGCDKCNKTFSVRGSLKVHERIHTGERPYCCDVCNKTFKQLEHLKKHHRVHTGERPYLCDVCNKTFSERGSLKLHEYVHTGERPYLCDGCGKTFIHKCTLKRHILSCCNQQSKS